MATGISSSWAETTETDIEDFLTSWSHSSISLLNIGYRSIHRLHLSSFYAQRIGAEAANYPGPPQWGLSQLNKGS